MNSKIIATLGFAALTAGSLAAPAAAQTFTTQTIMTGLYNPRGLAFGSDGGLYVAEAGVGGTGPSIMDGTGATVSYGETGGVSRLLNGTQSRILSDLPSLAGPGGGGAGGLTGITFAANGTAYGVINFGGEASTRDSLTTGGAAKAAQLGTVVQFNFGATPSATTVSDITAYALANNIQGPTRPGLPPETNPYGLTALQGGGVAVTDAGANFVATTNSSGSITGHLLLPNYSNPSFPAVGGPTYQAVPTGITQAPDGTLYVAELAGFPFTVGGAHIDVIKNGALVNSFGGFTTLVDVQFANGELYALALTTNGLAGPPSPGQLLEIDPLTGQITTLFSGLDTPGGLAIGSDNAFYITTASSAPGGGSVIRVASVPEPGATALLIGMMSMGAGIFRKRRK